MSSDWDYVDKIHKNALYFDIADLSSNNSNHKSSLQFVLSFSASDKKISLRENVTNPKIGGR